MLKKHRNALVTGGSTRIGKAIVEDLAANGYGVAIHAHSSTNEAEELAGVINAKSPNGASAKVVTADLLDIDQTTALIDQASQAIGPIDVLVNNASVFERDSLTDIEAELMDAHWGIHVRAPVFLTKAFAAQKNIENGLVVNVIDQRVLRLTPGFFSYTLSKSALWTATQTMAQALAPTIRVNAIGPGPTLPNERQNQKDFEKQVAAIPLGVAIPLTDFGRTIRYLDETTSITGQMIALDGGQHLAWETPDVVGIKE